MDNSHIEDQMIGTDNVSNSELTKKKNYKKKNKDYIQDSDRQEDESFAFTLDDLYKGIIISEILGKPKSL